MMGDVYANSYVTITGANISDDTRSFFKERPFDSALLRIDSNQGNVADVYLQNYDSGSQFFEQIINSPFKSFATEPLIFVPKYNKNGISQNVLSILEPRRQSGAVNSESRMNQKRSQIFMNINHTRQITLVSMIRGL
jgi:hypothetical protein